MAQSRKTAKKKVASRRASKAPVGVRGRRIRPLLGQYVYSAWLAEREIIRETATGSPRDLT